MPMAKDIKAKISLKKTAEITPNSIIPIPINESKIYDTNSSKLFISDYPPKQLFLFIIFSISTYENIVNVEFYLHFTNSLDTKYGL